jgi:hypothetical protein
MPAPLVAIIIGISLLIVAYTLWGVRRLNRIIQTWAEDNGYRLAYKQLRLIRQGPYFWNSRHGQAVLRIIVADEWGNERSGWIRVTGAGILRPPIVDTKWDD